jgi:hypothetical protein
MPSLPILFFFLCIGSDQSLFITALCFFTLKTIDYSIRNVVIELAYTSLNFDSRFLGKEIIGVLGNRCVYICVFWLTGVGFHHILTKLQPLRLGKSGISFFLSLIPFFVGDLDLGLLMKSGLVMSICWLYTAYNIAKRVQRDHDITKKEN